MTLNSTTTKITYNGDGATTVFTVNFIFWNNSDLRVIHRDASGVETVWIEGTHYTLVGGAGSTGVLTAETAPTDYTPTAGETLTIKDYQSEVQGDSLPLSGAFPSTVVEQRLDKLTRLIQIHSEEIARSILLPETSSVSGLTIPEPGAGELVRYNPAGTSLETVKAADLSLGVDTLLTDLATNDFLRWDNAQGAWVNLATGATGLALLQDATLASAFTTLGVDAAKVQALGTAAVVNTGVANGNAIVADATGLPVIDGSQVTNVWPRGYIDGLTLSNDPTDPAKDIGIAAGACKDYGDAADITLTSAMIKKLDASWAVGTNQGALDGTESVAGIPDADTWYHIWLIRRSDTGVVDILTSESATSPTMPTNYDQKRRIGAVLFDATPDIITFKQFGDEFLWVDPPLDVNTTALSTTAILYTISVPTGISTIANINALIKDSFDNGIYISSTYVNDEVPSLTAAPLMSAEVQYYTAQSSAMVMIVRTDISGQIRARGSAPIARFRVATLGWIDPRGKNA